MQTRSGPSLVTLHRLALRAAIPGYERMSKSELYQRLEGQFNMDRLLRAESRSEGSKRSRTKRPRDKSTDDTQASTDSKEKKLSSKKRKLAESTSSINKLDPIMLEPIKENPFFFLRPNGTVVAFNIDSLIDYLLHSGEFHDPETRIPFSDSDLKRMDQLATVSGLKKSSVFDAKMRAPQLYSDMKFRRDAILGLERCAGELINEIMAIIEEADEDSELILLLEVFPSFADLFRQMWEADREYARLSMSHWITFIKGPPNKPTQDHSGLQPIILQFLQSCLKDPR